MTTDHEAEQRTMCSVVVVGGGGGSVLMVKLKSGILVG